MRLHHRLGRLGSPCHSGWVAARKIAFATLVSLASGLTLCESSSPAQDKGIAVLGPSGGRPGWYGKSVAFVVGIDAYSGGWPALSAAVSDAERVAAELKRHGFEVHLLLNKEASKDEIMRYLYDVIPPQLGPEDRFVFYFSGHGQTENAPGGQIGYLVPVNGRMSESRDQFFTYISMNEVRSVLMNKYDAKHVLVVADACFSGLLTNRAPSPSHSVEAALRHDGKMVISAGGKGQRAVDGLFTNVFVQGMGGKADSDVDGWVTFGELALFVKQKVDDRSEGKQTPLYTWWEGEGEMVFVAAGGAVVERPAGTGREGGNGWIRVTSTPSGAAVLVDGREVGATPLADLGFPAGRHEVWVKKQGYEPYGKQVDLGAGRSLSLIVELVPSGSLKGRLFVEADPREASVRILPGGAEFSQGMELDPGRLQIEVSAPGYETHTRWVDVVAGEDESLTVRLARSPAEPSPAATEATTPGPEAPEGMVYIRGGTFWMGCVPWDWECDGDEKPRHEVTLDSFFMDAREVSQADYEKVMGNNPSEFKNCPDCPVEGVIWADACKYCQKNSARLPTEAEWEYAARGGKDGEVRYGDLEDIAWSSGQAEGKPHPVGQKLPNGYGLYDMLGNVWEWCSDWYGENFYRSTPVSNPRGPASGSFRVLRGGSWNYSSRILRASNRNRYSPINRPLNVGFRCVRDVK